MTKKLLYIWNRISRKLVVFFRETRGKQRLFKNVLYNNLQYSFTISLDNSFTSSSLISCKACTSHFADYLTSSLSAMSDTLSYIEVIMKREGYNQNIHKSHCSTKSLFNDVKVVVESKSESHYDIHDKYDDEILKMQES